MPTGVYKRKKRKDKATSPIKEGKVGKKTRGGPLWLNPIVRQALATTLRTEIAAREAELVGLHEALEKIVGGK